MTDRLPSRCASVTLFAVLLTAFGVSTARAETTLVLGLKAGLNYETAVVTPQVTDAPADASLTLLATDPEKGTVSSTMSPATVRHDFGNLTRAQTVVMDGYIVDGGTTNATAHELLTMGRVHDRDDPETGAWDDRWMHATAETYTNGTGYGVWYGTNFTSVADGQIAVDTTPASNSSVQVGCTVGPVPTPRRGSVITAELTFPWAYTELPDPTGQRFGLTVGVPDEVGPEEANFLFVTNGAWCTVPVAVCDPLVSSNWLVCVSVDYDRQLATYYVRPSAADAWTILGTATEVGEASIEEASFRGIGAITSLDGHGFDSILVRVDVEFDERNLHPGCNFEETIVTGRVVATEVHETDLASGNYRVRLVDLDGNEIAVQGYDFRLGTLEFYVRASDLTAGVGYRAEVAIDTSAEVNLTGADQIGVMGRGLTNVHWAATNLWIYENAQTFDYERPGSGLWWGRSCASTRGDWICVRADSEAAVEQGVLGISFEPTNRIEESYSTLATSIRAVFTEACLEPGETEAAFGFTVSSGDDGLCFLCLSNSVWQAVPRSLLAPVLNVEYELMAYVQIDEQVVNYVIRPPDGRLIPVMSVALEVRRFDEISRVDVNGVGDVTDLKACPYSTDLLRIKTEFGDGNLQPGTNFEESVSTGRVTFDQLWETDRTNGTLRIVVRDRNGLIVNQRYLSFRGIDDALTFDWLIRNLKPGETYSVDVIADVKGVDSDAASDSSLMARVVTNALWATTNLWVRENVRTFAGVEPGTGLWMTNGVQAVTNGEYIAIDTTGAVASDASVAFLATNTLPTHTGFEYRMHLLFDSVDPTLPELEGAFGCAVLEEGDEETGIVHRFAVMTNGVWTAIETDIYEPRPEVEYELTVHVDIRERLGYYAVRAPWDKRPTVLVEYELNDASAKDAYEVAFYGNGRVRTLGGDGFDVRLVEIEPAYDETSFVAGTNFAQTAVSGTLQIRQLWPTDRTSGTCSVVVRDSHGNVVAIETLTYDQLTNQSFNVFIDDLEAGGTYDVEVSSEAAGEMVTSEGLVVVMGLKHGAWIHEDPATFAHETVGTGEWVVTNEAACVVTNGDVRTIRVSVNETEEPVRFLPTNETMSVRFSTLREVRAQIDFADIGWYASGHPPQGPSNVLAAATVWCDDTGVTGDELETALGVIGTNGLWCVVESTRRRFSAQEPCTLTMLVDLTNGFVRYTLAADSWTNRVYQYDIDAPGLTDLKLAFSGTGNIRALDGDVWDPNLIRSSTNEFADLDSAIRATEGLGEILSPLWLAEQTVTVPRGTFRVLDTNDWLTIHFPDWYYVTVTSDGQIRIYRFNSSNNWIDYAEDGETNIVIDVERSLFFVKTPEGLSWLAALATNEWVSGRIELATNIDLTVHNWTPIAGFSGAFDGNGWTITGLNNTNCCWEIPGGTYLSGPTNAWGRSTYGLFGTATNATLSDVTFAGVAISNLADSVAALAGALAGNCTVSNVTVESGSILGAGETVAGLAGYADFTDLLAFVSNTNRACVTARSDGSGAPHTAAGLLCVAGPTDADAPLGTVIVTNNVNTGLIAATLRDADLFGGNVAQILAGAVPGARFGDVWLTDNVAAGAVRATHVNTQVSGWGEPDYPAVNLASAFWGPDANGTFYHALDANVPGAIPVDPVYRTARMLSDRFSDGATNEVGLVNDELTTLPAGSTYVLAKGVNEWDAIRLDRDITFDLNGQTIFTIWVNNTFEVTAGVDATVRNGTVVVGSESEPFGDVVPTTENLTVERLEEDFWERTTLVVNDEHGVSLVDLALDVEALNAAGTVIQLYEDTSVSIDVEHGVLQLNGVTFAQLSDAYAFKPLRDGNGDLIGYRVRLADTAAKMPTATVTLGPTEVQVSVGNTHAGMSYVLQRKDSLLATDWTTVGTPRAVTTEGESFVLTAPVEGAQGYYRIMATETSPEE